MLAVVGMEAGFETDNVAVISEQDILGDRLVRPGKASRQARQLHLRGHKPRKRRSRGPCRTWHRAVSSACRRSTSAGAPHDCLELRYAAETKLFLPVENIELLSRYGSDHANVELDQARGSGWQARKQNSRTDPRDRRRADQDRRHGTCMSA